MSAHSSISMACGTDLDVPLSNDSFVTSVSIIARTLRSFQRHFIWREARLRDTCISFHCCFTCLTKFARSVSSYLRSLFFAPARASICPFKRATSIFGMTERINRNKPYQYDYTYVVFFGRYCHVARESRRRTRSALRTPHTHLSFQRTWP